ncbi:MAG: serine/threonine protein kinase [Bacteroidales bacterium]|nr:serine/threonine protein kinase [Bacteroidales bacterium]
MTSSSGEITSSFEKISDTFTAYAEIPSQGFNRLFKAQRYGKWYVLKGLKPEYQQKEVYRQLLSKEFELGVQMEHPNIARIFSKESCDSVAGPCVVMEYVDGCTLKEFLSQKPSRNTRMKIAKEILSAMAYYHSKQIIHRDLKPDNILITNNGHNVKLIDFGLADSDYHGILKQPAGSDKYAAPEQKAGNVAIDNRADIYAFGVILRQLFPHDYGGIVRKCTQANREKRYNNAEEILRRLQRSRQLIPIFITLVSLLIIVVGAWMLWPMASEVQSEPLTPETEEIAPSVTPSENIGEQQQLQTAPLPQAEPGNTAAPTTQMEKNSQTAQEKEVDVFSEEYIYRQIPSEAKRQIEQSLDTLFRPFWDWNRAAEAQGMVPIDKLAHYTESDFFKNNYDIRERHREVVVNDLLRRHPQCEPVKEKVTMYYNALFAKKMIAVNNVVVGWQKAVR